jgi:ATP-dependent Clp protease ATP-binding subunit ClpX
MLPTPRELEAYLDRMVIGQKRAKRVLATSVYTHFLLAAARRDSSAFRQGSPGTGRAARQHVLLLGPTGSGKSLLVRTLAEFLGVPFVRADATRMTEAGYVGEDATTLLTRLIKAAGGDPKKAEQGIIFVDEIDKTASEPGLSEVSRTAVQQSLLAILDGGEQRFSNRDSHEHSIDTSFIWFVCAGAFPGLEQIVERRHGAPSRLGFLPPSGGANGASEGSVVAEEGLAEEGLAEEGLAPLHPFELADAADLAEYGLLPEFVGRFGSITALEELGEAELCAILRDAEDGVLQQERELFALHGIELRIEEDVYSGLARRALQRKTGARSLDQAVQELLRDLHFDLPDLAERGVHSVRVEDPEQSGQPRCSIDAFESELAGGSYSQALRLEFETRPEREVAQPECRPGGSLRKRLLGGRKRPQDLEELEREAGVPALDPDQRVVYDAMRRHFCEARYLIQWILERLGELKCELRYLVEALQQTEAWDAEGLVGQALFLRAQQRYRARQSQLNEQLEALQLPKPRRRRERRSRWVAGLVPFVQALSPLERRLLDALGDGELTLVDLMRRTFLDPEMPALRFLQRVEVALRHLIANGIVCVFDSRKPESEDLDGRELFPLKRALAFDKSSGRWTTRPDLAHIELYRASDGEGQQADAG